MVKKQTTSVRVTKSMDELLFCHFLVTNVDEWQKSFKYYSWKEPPITVCLGVAQACSKVAWMWSSTDGNLSYLCLGTTSLLVPETYLKSKILKCGFELPAIMGV